MTNVKIVGMSLSTHSLKGHVKNAQMYMGQRTVFSGDCNGQLACIVKAKGLTKVCAPS